MKISSQNYNNRKERKRNKLLPLSYGTEKLADAKSGLGVPTPCPNWLRVVRRVMMLLPNYTTIAIHTTKTEKIEHLDGKYI